MERLTVDDIDPLADYEANRATIRKEMTELRALRRVPVGDACVVVFENRDTVKYQVQEMLRVERQDSPERVALNLSCFNLLIPDRNELCATLMITVEEFSSLCERLEAMKGFTKGCLCLVVGEHVIPAIFEVEDDSACESDVLYIRFKMSDAQAQAFRDLSIPAAIRARHAECHVDVAIEGELRLSLIEDLSL